VTFRRAVKYSALFAVVVLIGFSGRWGTVFGTTVMAASGMAQADQGLVGGVVNTTRQVGAAIGVAVLVAIARAPTHALGSPRSAEIGPPVGGGVGGAERNLVAWFGARTLQPGERTAAATAAPQLSYDMHTTTEGSTR